MFEVEYQLQNRVSVVTFSSEQMVFLTVAFPQNTTNRSSPQKAPPDRDGWQGPLYLEK